MVFRTQVRCCCCCLREIPSSPSVRPSARPSPSSVFLPLLSTHVLYDFAEVAPQQLKSSVYRKKLVAVHSEAAEMVKARWKSGVVAKEEEGK